MSAAYLLHHMSCLTSVFCGVCVSLYRVVVRQKEFAQGMCHKIKDEHNVNDMKRRYNRHLSSTTTIKDVSKSIETEVDGMWNVSVSVIMVY